MKDSPSAPLTLSMEEEPSVATVPVAEAAAEVWAEVAGAALVSWAASLLLLAPQPAIMDRAMRAANTRLSLFFIVKISFSK